MLNHLENHRANFKNNSSSFGLGTLFPIVFYLFLFYVSINSLLTFDTVII